MRRKKIAAHGEDPKGSRKVLPHGVVLRDAKTVEGFGYEWTRFDQRQVDPGEIHRGFSQYFRVFPWDGLRPDAVGFDLGCGSGRWARVASDCVGTLLCIDPSWSALSVAISTLADKENCRFLCSAAGEMPIAPKSMDFGYSLGVLHHTLDPAKALLDAVATLKPGAPLLVYLYYALDNRPRWFRPLWRATDVVRRLVSILPTGVRYGVTSVIAVLVYLPMARLAATLEARGRDVEGWPLCAYRAKSFYTMRTDAFDRFSTRIEHRFTAEELRRLMEDAGLDDIVVSPEAPYWCAVGYRAGSNAGG